MQESSHQRENVSGSPSLIAHIEHYLGRIQAGWTKSPDGKTLGFQVVKCAGDSYLEHVRAFCTVGLSHYPFKSRVSKKLIRQELLILVPEAFGDRNVPVVLQQLASAALVHRSPYLCGEVIERRNHQSGGSFHTRKGLGYAGGHFREREYESGRLRSRQCGVS